LCATVFAEGADVATVNNAQYNKECGACHFAYPPGLLPARSWDKLFSSLNKHFGENAELDDSVTQTLKTYATQNAADKSNYSRSVKIMRALRDGETPMRITELAYIRAKHHEIPTRMVAGNPKVGSLSKCEACHQHAAAGSFSEHDVKIPGFGRWE
ncbi:MAG: diheme cytochrome c, partial [Gammaproteobacteria bacterium]|nr:diheme cytochrome c [Gammaproteobacteria bacterium]